MVVPKARTVAVSSAEVYGIVPNEELPVRETQPLHPQTPYGASKAAADLVAEQAARGALERTAFDEQRATADAAPHDLTGTIVTHLVTALPVDEGGFLQHLGDWTREATPYAATTDSDVRNQDCRRFVS